MWTASEITQKVRNGEISIRWDLMPQPVVESTVFTVRESGDLERLREMRRATVGYYFCVDVWDCQARLVLIEYRECGARVAGKMEGAPEGILIGAVEEAGGAINLNGHYPPYPAS